MDDHYMINDNNKKKSNVLLYMREYHINSPLKMFNEAIYFKDYLLFKTKKKTYISMMEREVSEIMLLS